MANWRDNLLPASFRGVPFKVDSTRLSAGRRLARHEYPQRDKPFLEDMGRAAREYTVEAFILGPDYMAGRDKLLAALEASGAGELIHPGHGRMQVIAQNASLSESTQYGGLARFSITFIEAGERIFPEIADTTERLEATSDDVFKALHEDFIRAVSLAKLPEHTLARMRADMGSLLALAGLPLSRQQKVGKAFSTADSGALADALIAPIRDGSARTGPLIEAAPKNASPEAIALSDLLARAATTQEVETLAKTPPETQEEAEAARLEIARLIDAAMDGDDGAPLSTSAEAALTTLRLAAIACFDARAAGAPRLSSRTMQTVRPALVTAYALYGPDFLADGRESRLVARNGIRHPGFVPAGRPIEFET